MSTLERRFFLFILLVSVTLVVFSNFHISQLNSNYFQVKYGLRYQELNDRHRDVIEETHSISKFTVDILSVASVTRQDLVDVQKRTFGSHVSVRNFFNVTELDDSDPECYRLLTWDAVKKVISFCRNRPPGLSRFFHYMRGHYAREQWLEKKGNPAGWLCAQKRPYSGLKKVYSHYQENNQALPDFFVVADDDTFLNIEYLQESFQSMNVSEPSVVAGCLIRHPIHLLNFTFPFGGFGTILSKGALINLFRPINCDNRADDDIINQQLCEQLSNNVAGELRYFSDGMSLVELIYKYVSEEEYRNVDQWTSGFCMHSDWVGGYFYNFYNVSKHVKDPFYVNVPHARIEAFQGSEIYREGKGFCNNEKDCAKGSAVCHRPSVEWMETEFAALKIKSPGQYREG